MKKYKVILTESEMRKLNEVRRNDDEFITVDHIDKSNYKKYIGRKVNARGYVNLSGLDLRKIPITFGRVGGDFYCGYNKFTSLTGAPEKVGGNFYCVSNRLTSLEGAPEKVGGSFNCSGNQLTSLEGAPREVGGNFYCDNNKLTSLEGAPEKVGESFYCWGNPEEFTVADVKAVSTVGGDIEVSSGQ